MQSDDRGRPEVERARAELYGHVESFVERIEECRSDEEILGLLCEGGRALGATACYFAAFDREKGSTGPFTILLSCDPRWGLEYERNRCFESDPWLEYCRISSEPVTTSQIRCSSAAMQAFVCRAEPFGFRSVIVAPAPATGTASQLGMLVLGHPEPGHFERSSLALAKVAARGLAMEVRERRGEIARQELLEEATLTPLELSLLRLAAQGLSSKAIAKATGLSATAVDMRFHRLSGKLRCPDRKASSRLAAICGLI